VTLTFCLLTSKPIQLVQRQYIFVSITAPKR